MKGFNIERNCLKCMFRSEEVIINRVPESLEFTGTYKEYEVDVVKCYATPEATFIGDRVRECALYKRDINKT